MNPQPVGLSILRLPWMYTQYDAAYTVHGLRFPLVPPVGTDMDLPTSFRATILQRDAFSTLPQSRTKIAASAINMSPHLRLSRVKVSDQLWNRLVAYTNPGTGHAVRTTHSVRHKGACPAIPTPQAPQMRQAVVGLWGWFLSISAHEEQTVASEEDVAGQIFKQFLDAVNFFLQVRYLQHSGNMT